MTTKELRERNEILRQQLAARWEAGEQLTKSEYHKMVAFTKAPKKKVGDFEMRDFYKSYKIMTRDNIEYRISEGMYGKVVETFFRKSVRDMIQEGIPIEIRPGFGEIRIESYKPRGPKQKRRVDICSTMRNGFCTYYMNEHSNGIVYKHKWIRNRSLPFMDFYRFDPKRYNRKALSERIFQGNVKFLPQ